MSMNPVTPDATAFVTRLIDANLRLTDRILELTQPQQTTHAPAVEWGTAPLYDTEEVDDARWQYSEGLIDKGELQEVLKKAGYSNTHVEVID